MASNPLNGFGSDTYWNQPTSRSRTRRPTRSLSPTNRQIMDPGITPTAQRTANTISFTAAAPASSNALLVKAIDASGNVIKESTNSTVYAYSDNLDANEDIAKKASPLPIVSTTL